MIIGDAVRLYVYLTIIPFVMSNWVFIMEAADWHDNKYEPRQAQYFETVLSVGACGSTST